jgi:DNA-binding NarL/FixJ family response regulator
VIKAMSKTILFLEGVKRITDQLDADIVIVDIDTCSLAEAKATYPDHALIAVTYRQTTPISVYLLIREGAVAVLMRPSSMVFLRTIELVAIGGKGVVPSLQYPYATETWTTPVVTELWRDIARRLSNEERKIIRLVAQGLKNKEIANRLDKAVATVKVQLCSIMHKLELSNRTQVAVWHDREQLYERSTSDGLQDRIA